MLQRFAFLSLLSLLLLPACGQQDRRPPGARQCTVYMIEKGSALTTTVSGELVQADDSWVIVKMGEDTYIWVPKENVSKVELEPAPAS